MFCFEEFCPTTVDEIVDVLCRLVVTRRIRIVCVLCIDILTHGWQRHEERQKLTFVIARFEEGGVEFIDGGAVVGIINIIGHEVFDLEGEVHWALDQERCEWLAFGVSGVCNPVERDTDITRGAARNGVVSLTKYNGVDDFSFDRFGVLRGSVDWCLGLSTCCSEKARA